MFTVMVGAWLGNKALVHSNTQQECDFTFDRADFERPNNYSTPDLIKMAVAEGFISEGKGYVFLTRRFLNRGDFPIALTGQKPWSGTSSLRQIVDFVVSDKFCEIPKCQRDEIEKYRPRHPERPYARYHNIYIKRCDD